METTILWSKQQILGATKKRGIEMIRANLQVSDAWVYRALVAIYERQTADEQQSGCTRHDNKVGFSGLDASILSSFATQVKNWNPATSRYDRPLSPKQMAIARNKIQKYSGQLYKIATHKEQADASESQEG